MSKVDFSEATADRKLREWAESFTRQFLAARGPDTLDHYVGKKFSEAQLVELASIAYLADDLIAEDAPARVANPTAFRPRPEMQKVFNALYDDFGYIAGFLGFIRHHWDLSFRLARDLVDRPRRLPQGVLVAGVGVPLPPSGLRPGTEDTVRHVMRNRFFVRACAVAKKRWKLTDHATIQKELARIGISVTASAVKNALGPCHKKKPGGP